MFEELVKQYPIEFLIKVATMSSMIKLVREHGKEFSEVAQMAALKKMYPGIELLDLNELISIGTQFRKALKIEELTATRQEIVEIKQELASFYHKDPKKPLTKPLMRLSSWETYDGWVSIGGQKFAITPTRSVDYDGDTPNF